LDVRDEREAVVLVSKVGMVAIVALACFSMY
jgi:hypothetical protein